MQEVCRFRSARAAHVLDDEGRVSGHVLFKERRQVLGILRVSAARTRSDDHRDGFSLVEIGNVVSRRWDRDASDSNRRQGKSG